MEFSIDRKYFLDKLTLVSRAIAPHSPLPVLNGIRIQLFEDRMVLTGSDKEFTIQTTIRPDEESQLEIEQPGSTVVDSRILLELIRRMNTTVLKVITSDGDLMRLSARDGNFDLIGREAAAYPDLALEQPQTHIQLPASLLKEIYEQTAYAASEKNSRQVLMGINLQVGDGKIAATATDSYRLALKVAPLETGETSFRVTIPTAPFGEAVHSFGSSEMIDTYVDRRKIQFVFGDTLIQSQLYEGNFPEAARIIPVKYMSTLKVSAGELEGMLNRSTIYTSSSSSSGSIVPVQMNCSAEDVGMRVLSSDIGSCKQRLDSPVYQGDELSVSFNAKLMLDALRGLHSQDQVQLDFTGELRPIKITNPDDPTLTMIVVPIRSS